MENVLFFLFRLYGGGAERVVSNLSMDLAQQYNIKIAIFDNSEQTYPFRGELIRIKLPFSGNTAENKLFARMIRFFILIYKLKKLKKIHHIKVTISFAEQANIINVLTKGKTRTILSVRTFLSKQISGTSNATIIRLLVRMLYNRADLIITPSKVAGEDMVEQFGIMPHKLKVIYNYVNKERILSLSLEEIEDSFHRQLFRQPVLLNVGRVTPAKGQWILLEMMVKIKTEFRGWKMVIIGGAESEGELKTQLTALAEGLGLELYDSSSQQPPSLDYDVYLLGFQVNPFRYMRQSQMLLFPSVYEGFPNTVLEAMQSGLPVVVADCLAGPREILAPDTELKLRIAKMEVTHFGILCPALRSTDIKEPVPQEILNEWMNAFRYLANETELKNKFVQNGYTRVGDFDKNYIIGQWKQCMDTK
jgi:glycosyltransferase involved in cell wall biosynthesis